jgi:hypothetical protein
VRRPDRPVIAAHAERTSDAPALVSLSAPPWEGLE